MQCRRVSPQHPSALGCVRAPGCGPGSPCDPLWLAGLRDQLSVALMASDVGASEQSSGLPGTCPEQLLSKQTWALGHGAAGGQLSGRGRQEEELDLLVPSPSLNRVNAFLFKMQFRK